MVRQGLVVGVLAIAALCQAQQTSLADAPQAQAVPDAPKPQTLPNLGDVTPGSGTTANPTSTSSQPAAPPDSFQTQAPASSLPAEPAEGSKPAANQAAAPDLPTAGQGSQVAASFSVRTNFVEVPFTVKDVHNQLVPGITWREIRVYENGLRQHLALFTVDPFPLSVALVIDQSMTFDEMTRVNNSLSAMQGAFTPYDEIAVFTYNNGPRMETDFTAAQSPRLTAVLDRSKTPGREPMFYDTGSALGQNINLNGGAQDHYMPLVNSQHGTGGGSNTINVPREVHTLNDAILEAAKATTRAGKNRRRIVYVISDGKEFGSTAKTKEVIRYLQTNKIAVYGTLIHSLPSIKGEGFLDRIHLPLQMRGEILPVYAGATGGQIDPEFRQRGIEQSFGKIAEQVRTQYTVGYYSNEPMLDGKFRKLEIKVLRPNLTVIAKDGYYPTATATVPTPRSSAQ